MDCKGKSVAEFDDECAKWAGLKNMEEIWTTSATQKISIGK